MCVRKSEKEDEHKNNFAMEDNSYVMTTKGWIHNYVIQQKVLFSSIQQCVVDGDTSLSIVAIFF